jgi:TorA maturation chaperone TorD
MGNGVRTFEGSGVREFPEQANGRIGGNGVRRFESSKVRKFPEQANGRTSELSNDLQGLLARAAVARALALAFAPPHGPALAFLKDRLAAKVAEAGACLEEGPALRRAAEAAAGALGDAPSLPGEYDRLFRTDLAATPYETEYGLHPAARKGPELADILGFYQAFGFRPAPAASELPDHVGAELEFLSLLLVKEADAGRRGAGDEAAVASEAAGKFFGDHLGRWSLAFCRRVREAARHPFYVVAAHLLETFMAGEAGRLGRPLGEASQGAAASSAECLACPLAPPAAAEVDRAPGP